tara:strand:- start:334 stop:471 length:138 start_codon:yes stop_codon:yes gene_type:complete
MKKLVKEFSKLDGLYKGGVVFLLAFIIPCLVGVSINLVENGSNLL